MGPHPLLMMTQQQCMKLRHQQILTKTIPPPPPTKMTNNVTAPIINDVDDVLMPNFKALQTKSYGFFKEIALRYQHRLSPVWLGETVLSRYRPPCSRLYYYDGVTTTNQKGKFLQLDSWHNRGWPSSCFSPLLLCLLHGYAVCSLMSMRRSLIRTASHFQTSMRLGVRPAVCPVLRWRVISPATVC